MDQKPFNDIFAQTNGQERSARWYQTAVREYASGINTFQEVQNSDLGKVATQLDVGKMYMFAYDPMTKETLPYWDNLPLVVICDPLPTGFSGINLHYLSPLLRANLLDRLMPSVDKVDSDSKLRSDWSFVRNFSRFPETRKSTKRYLTQQIRGQMIEVNPRHWKSAVFLPVQQFQGASASKIYRDTMTKPERRRRQV